MREVRSNVIILQVTISSLKRKEKAIVENFEKNFTIALWQCGYVQLLAFKLIVKIDGIILK